MWRMISRMNHAATPPRSGTPPESGAPVGSGTPPTSGTPDGAEDRHVADDSAGGPESTLDPHPWADAARPRGLDAYFAPGGEDEAPPERVADERRLTRLLIVMVLLLVGVPTLLTLVAFVAQLASLRPGG
jgi:hypothetical protein